MCLACNEHSIDIAAGEVLEGAIESERRGRRGKYSNNACEIWHIRAEENQVDLYVVFQNKNPYLLYCCRQHFISYISYQTQHIVFYCIS